MEPIEFKESNMILAEDQPEYLPLPIHISVEDMNGTATSCWQFTWKERLAILFGKPLWLQILTFHRGFAPVLPRMDKPFEDVDNG